MVPLQVHESILTFPLRPLLNEIYMNFATMTVHQMLSFEEAGMLLNRSLCISQFSSSNRFKKKEYRIEAVAIMVYRRAHICIREQHLRTNTCGELWMRAACIFLQKTNITQNKLLYHVDRSLHFKSVPKNISVHCKLCSPTPVLLSQLAVFALKVQEA